MISATKAVCRLATVSIIYLASTESTHFASASATSSEQPNAQSAGKLRSLGEAAMAERRFDEAASYYAKAIDVEPDNASNYFKLFRVHSRMRSYNSALKDITGAIQIDEKNPEYRFQKAKLLVSLGLCSDAVDEYDIIGVNNNYVHMDFDQLLKGQTDAVNCEKDLKEANKSMEMGAWQNAVKFYTKALHHIDQNFDILLRKSEAEFKTADYYGTVSDTGKILKANSKNIEAYQLRGMAYYMLGEHDTATQHYREGLKLDPEHSGCKKQHKLIKSILKKEKRGDDAAAAGKHVEAIEYWWQAIGIDESHRAFVRPTMLKIVKSHSALGQHDEALAVAQKHIDESASVEGLHALGDVQMDAEKYQDAINSFRSALDFEPNEIKNQSQEKLQKAEIALKQSKEKNYYKILGLSRNADKKAIKKAYRDLALKWHPDKAEDKEKAEKLFPDISEAYEVLSDGELRGKYDRGEEVFENQGGGGGGRGHHGFPEQMFQQHFRQSRGHHRSQHTQFHFN